MSNLDVRWQQRFSNYRRVLEQLEGVFEYTFELAWNTLRDLLSSQGNGDLLGSRDTLREAFRLGLIADGEAWMLMIHDRSLTSHSYNCSTAVEIGVHIREDYLSCFQALRYRLDQRLMEEGS
jgi:nucleotidyltransferase substrate binding protein (TIGR01987 family)